MKKLITLLIFVCIGTLSKTYAKELTKNEAVNILNANGYGLLCDIPGIEDSHLTSFVYVIPLYDNARSLVAEAANGEDNMKILSEHCYYMKGNQVFVTKESESFLDAAFSIASDMVVNKIVGGGGIGGLVSAGMDIYTKWDESVKKGDYRKNIAAARMPYIQEWLPKAKTLYETAGQVYANLLQKQVSLKSPNLDTEINTFKSMSLVTAKAHYVVQIFNHLNQLYAKWQRGYDYETFPPTPEASYLALINGWSNKGSINSYWKSDEMPLNIAFTLKDPYALRTVLGYKIDVLEQNPKLLNYECQLSRTTPSSAVRNIVEDNPYFSSMQVLESDRPSSTLLIIFCVASLIIGIFLGSHKFEDEDFNNTTVSVVGWMIFLCPLIAAIWYWNYSGSRDAWIEEAQKTDMSYQINMNG